MSSNVRNVLYPIIVMNKERAAIPTFPMWTDGSHSYVVFFNNEDVIITEEEFLGLARRAGAETYSVINERGVPMSYDIWGNPTYLKAFKPKVNVTVVDEDPPVIGSPHVEEESTPLHVTTEDVNKDLPVEPTPVTCKEYGVVIGEAPVAQGFTNILDRLPVEGIGGYTTDRLRKLYARGRLLTPEWVKIDDYGIPENIRGEYHKLHPNRNGIGFSSLTTKTASRFKMRRPGVPPWGTQDVLVLDENILTGQATIYSNFKEHIVRVQPDP